VVSAERVHSVEGGTHSSLRATSSLFDGRRALQDAEEDEDIETVENLEDPEEDPEEEEEEDAEEEEEADEEGADKVEKVDEESEDDSEDDSVGPTSRECTYSQEGTEVEFECKARSVGIDDTVYEDKLKYKIDLSRKGVVVKVGHDQEVENSETETETEMGFDVRFDKLIEYRKIIADGVSARSAVGSTEAYQFGVDEIVQEWDLAEWNDGLSDISSLNNLLRFSAAALGDVAQFDFTIAQADEGPLNANTIKIDISLNGYNWTSDDTFLALVSHVETENEVEVKNDGKKASDESDSDGTDTVDSASGPRAAEEGSIDIDFYNAPGMQGYQPIGVYSWAPTAEATTMKNSTDGRLLQVTETIQVVATLAPGDDGKSKQDVAFSFVGAGRGASMIYWDPEAGVRYNAEGSSSASSTGYGASIAAFATIAVFAQALFF